MKTLFVLFAVGVLFLLAATGDVQRAVWDNGSETATRISTSAGATFDNYGSGGKYEKQYLDFDSLTTNDKIIIYNITENADTMPQCLKDISYGADMDSITSVSGKRTFEILNSYTHKVYVKAVSMSGSRPVKYRRITWD